MAIIAKPFQFKGRCAGCGKMQNGKGAAVGVGIDDDPGDRSQDVEPYAEWICGKCAARYAKKIIAALKRSKELVALGFIYRNDRWQPKSKRAA